MKPNKNVIRTCMVDAVILILFCVVAFAVPFVRTRTFWLAFVFGVAAIAVQLYVMKVAFVDGGDSIRSKFYGFPIARIGFIYMVAQVILSLLCMALAKWVPGWVALVVSAVVFGVAAVGFVAADATRDEVTRQDVQLKKDVTTMRALQSKLRMLEGQCAPETAAEVAKLSEAFRFSDPVSRDVLEDIEAELAACVDTLQQAVVDGDNDAVLSLCKKCTTVLHERNQLCKLNK